MTTLIVWLGSPPQSVGGPSGVGLLLSHAARRSDSSGHLVYLLGGQMGPLEEAPNAVVANSGGFMRRRLINLRDVVAAWRYTARHNDVHIVALCPVRLMAAIRLMPLVKHGDLRVVLSYSEHSKGGLHTEMRASRSGSAPRRWFYRIDALWSMALAQRVIFPSVGARTLFFRRNRAARLVAAKKTRIVYNGVSTDASVPERSKRSCLTILTVASHVPEKNLIALLDGFLAFAAESPSPAHLSVVGPFGPETEALASRLRGIPRSLVRLDGPLPQAEVMERMIAADVFALIPQVAVFDLALLEAMAAGLPVISSPVGGNLEALGAGYQYFASSASELRDALRALASSPALRARVGKTNRQRVRDHFSLDQMLAGYMSVSRLPRA